ncbi:MAG: hypothetical protein IH845_01790 [Nanoarchaeota archaeon]|nr:hypothetical protein [Nanoarchaeota archaeon]
MYVAIIGPICKEITILGEKRTEQARGVAYSTGQALASLGVQTTVFGSYNDNDALNNKDFKFDLEHIAGDIVHPETLSRFDYVVFEPLFNDNISSLTIKEYSRHLKGGNTKLVLASQGMFRYGQEDEIVWDKRKSVIDTLPSIDCVFFDKWELEFISGKAKIVDGAKYLLKEAGVKNVIVTTGSKGSRLFFGNSEYVINAFPTNNLVSTTGAGDSYMAGFLKAKGLKYSPYNCIKFASMTATMSIESNGPFNGTLEEVLTRVDEESKNL